MSEELTIHQKINILCNANNFYNSNELQNIISKHNINHTKNNNGVFFNLSLLDEHIINDIYSLFIMKNNDNILLYDTPPSTYINEPIYIPNNIDKDITDNYSKIQVKHKKIDYLILKILNENLNLI